MRLRSFHSLAAIAALGIFASCALGDVALAQSPITPKLALPAIDQMVVPELVSQVRANVWVITGALNNTTVIAGKTGLIIIDTQFTPRYPAIAARIAEVSPLPVKAVINTHYHYDHTGGNAQFRRAGALIVAHGNVVRRMRAPPPNPVTGLPDSPAPADALPTEIYAGPFHSFTAGGETVRLFHPAPAHTDGDTVIILSQENVIASGDIVGNHYPNIDVAVGGGILGTIRAVDQIIGMMNERTRLIPGHGPVLGRAEVIAFRTMLQSACDRIAKAKRAGMSEQQVASAGLLADLDPRWKGANPLSARFPINVYRSLP